MQVELLNDQPEFSGTGVYAWNLFRALALAGPSLTEGLAEPRMSFYDSRTGACRVFGPGAGERSIPARFPSLKPFFWWDCHRRLDHRDMAHFASQNLSFLRTKGRRIVTCLDLIPLVEPESPGEGLWRRLLYSGIRTADQVIAISEHTKNDLMRIYRLPSGRITVVPLGVSAEFHLRDKGVCRLELGLPPKTKILLHVGTPAKRKNFQAVCRAFAAVRRNEGGAVLVKVGRVSGAERSLAASLVIGDSLIVRDRVPAGQLPLYYSAADVFIFPSTYEGFGLPALEAMASGCPVVASSAASLPEVVGDAGLMHEPDDVRGMSESIALILGDSKKARKLSDAGRERASVFTWERTAKETLKVYQGLDAK